MYKIFNTNALTTRSRFLNGLIYGSIVALLLAVLYGLIMPFIMVEFTLFFIFMGYCIGVTICKMGRGVTIEFSILGAILTLLAIVLADMIAFYGISSILNFSSFSMLLMQYTRYMLSTNINSILSLLFRVVGVYAGYKYSRIV